MKMSFEDICEQIGLITERSELAAIHAAARERFKALSLDAARQLAQQFKTGDEVWFVSGRGEEVRGKITGFGPKNVKVKAETGVMWRVHPSFLRKFPELVPVKSV